MSTHTRIPYAEAFALAVRRKAAARMRLLARWAGGRDAVLAVVFEEEDRRSLRALLRGAVQGARAEERLEDLIPTPLLPERALAELARQARPAAIAALLTAWQNPYGPALLQQAGVLLHGRVRPHAWVHRRRDEGRAAVRGRRLRRALRAHTPGARPPARRCGGWRPPPASVC